MADVFISYKREDRAAAQRLAAALEQLGFEIWWDFDLLSGERYRKVIRTVIDQCKAAIVLWSERAIESDFVMDEAQHAKNQGKLCPARIDNVDLPFGFGSIHTDDLRDWEGELSHPGFQALVRAIETRVGRKGRLGAQQSPASQTAAAELDAFKTAQLAGNASALRAFLDAHPRGAFAGFVRGQLQTMGADGPSTPKPETPPRSQSPAPVASSSVPPGAKPSSAIWLVAAGAAVTAALTALVFALLAEPTNMPQTDAENASAQTPLLQTAETSTEPFAQTSAPSASQPAQSSPAFDMPVAPSSPEADILGVWREIERAGDSWGCTSYHRFTRVGSQIRWDAGDDGVEWREEQTETFSVRGQRVDVGRIAVEARGDRATIYSAGNAVCDLQR